MKTMATLQSRVSASGVLLVTFISATIALTALAGTPTCVPAPPGLVGWWAGEGNASDSAGTNNGALYGGMSFAAGEAGQAFSFNGSSGYVEMPASASLDVGAGAGLTFECWIEPATLAVAQPLAEWNSGTHAGLQLWISQPAPYGGGSGSIYVNLVDTTGEFHTLSTGAGILNTSGFQHVALSYDKASGMASLYYNGALVASGMLGSFTPQTSFDLYLGKLISDAPSIAFQGLMDEASLYSRALSAAEIQAIYNAGSAGKCPVNPGVAPSITTQPASQTVVAGSSVTFTASATGTAPLSYQWRFSGANIAGATSTSLTLNNVQPAQAGNYTMQVTNAYGLAISSNALLTVNPASGCVTPPAGLVGWWRGEGNGNDSAGTNNAYALPNVSFTNGIVGQAFAFDPENLPYGTYGGVQIADQPAYALTNSMTIEGWIRPRGDGYLIFHRGDNRSGLDPYAMGMALNNILSFGITGPSGATASVSAPIVYNQWWYVVGTLDDASGKLSLYTNGTLAAQITTAVRPFGALIPGDSPGIGIGNVNDGFNNFPFYGDIDEISLYNRALTGAEIQAIYQAGSAGKCPVNPGVAPSITTQPASQTVVAGSSVTFTASATGTAPLSYQWRLSGANIAGATGTSLTLSNVQAAQAGNYTMQVTNAYGSAISSNAILTVNPASGCVPPPAGLVGWWRGEGNGNDSAGTNNAYAMPHVSFTNGIVGQAFAFDPENLPYGTYGGVQIADQPYYALTNSLTIEGWIRPRGDGYIIFHRGDNRSGLDPYAMGMALNNILSFGITAASGTIASVSVPIVYNQWWYVVGTLDDASGKLSLYTNGTLAAQITTAVRPFGALIAGDSPGIGIGNENDGFNNFPFYGDIDEISLYNRALSAAEIQSIYNAGSAGKCTAGVAPSIITQPASQTVTAGSNVTFTASATGTAPLSYQWRFSGANIAGATGTSLTLNNVQGAQAGSYTMQVTNTYGSAISSNAVLTVNQASGCAPPPAGLVSWWRGESDATDSVNTNNGTLVNGAAFAAGEVGQAFSLNGVNQYVSVLDSVSLRPTNVTLECWVNFATTTGIRALVAKPYGTGVYDSFALWYQDGQLNGNITTTTGTTPVLRKIWAPVLGTWHHVAYAFDSGAHSHALYLDGVAVAMGTANGSIAYDTGPLLIGADIENGAYSYFHSGLLDEVSLYSRALTAGEIQTIYNAGSAGKCVAGTAPVITTQPANQTVAAGSTATFSVAAGGTAPLGYQWQFNGINLAGATGNTLNLSNVQSGQAGSYSVLVTNVVGSAMSSNAVLTINSPGQCAPPPAGLISWWRGEGNVTDSVNTNNGTLVNGATFAAGEVGQAFSLNGTNQYISVPDTASLRPTNVTLECWANFATTTGIRVLVAKPYGSALYNSYCLWYQNGQLNGGITTTTLSTPVLRQTWAPALGTWHHVAYTLDSGTHMQALYLDGVAVVAGTAGGTIAYDNQPLLIGVDISSGVYSYFHGGLLDEVSIYNRALAAAEIQAIYNAGSAGKCPVGSAPSIITQPASQTVVAGTNATFNVTAAGTAPLSYQWQFNGTNVAGATGTSLSLGNVQGGSAGSYSVLVTNAFGMATSQVATLTVLVLTPQTLLDVNFAAYSQVKLGFAGTGQTASDFWNNCTAPFQQLVSLSNLIMADGSPTTVGLILQNGAGTSSFTHPDLMYNCFCYSQDNGDIILTVTNLPSGQYDFYLYGHAGVASANTVFELLIGGTDYGNEPTTTSSNWALTNFVEGAQYVVYRSVAVTNGGAPVTILAHPGSSGYALLNGIQIATSIPGAPVISVQPTNQVITAGFGASFSVTAYGTQPLGYQWLKGGVVLSGANSPTLQLVNTTTNDAGAYDVVVTNTFGAVTSQVATLTVLVQTTPTLLDVNFAAYSQVKVGFAGTGQTATDFWNNCTAPFQQLVSLSNLIMADGAPTAVGLTLQNGAGTSSFTHPDLMYNCFCYSQNNGDILVTVTNLPSGQYDFYLYGHAGVPIANTVFQLQVGGANYGNEATSTNSDSLGTSFVEGAQYVVYRNAAVTNGGAPVTILAHPGSSGYALLNGIQIAASPVRSPIISVQPTNQVITAGSNAFFSVTASGAAPLGYQWLKGGIVLSGANSPTLQIANTTTNDAGAYDVVVTNTFGAATSQVATLTVLAPTPQTLLDVNFAAYSQVKVGFAGTGQTATDFWNNCTAPFQPLVSLSNLIMADGAPTTVGLILQNGAGTSGFTHPDLMYNCFCYSQNNGDIILTVTNLSSGQYDFYLYGHAGAASANTVFQLLIGGMDYGNQPTTTSANWALTNFVEGAQYVVYRSVAVTNAGAPVTIKAHPGSSGYALLNGIQISSTAGVGQVQTQTAQIQAVVPSGSAGSTMQLQVRGAPSRVYVIQASTNLIDWVTLGLGLTDTAGNVVLTDPNAANQPLRFYRAVGQ